MDSVPRLCEATDLRFETLDRVLEQIPFEGYLAGGCVRDTIYGKAVKDYDFYCWNDFAAPLYEKYPNHRIQSKPDLIAAGYPLDFLMDVVDTGEYIDGKELQIMMIKSEQFLDVPDFIDQNFDLGICKVLYNKEQGLIRLHDFDRDEQDNCITYTPSKYNYYSQDHVDRVVAKYPDRRLDVSAI